MDNLLTVAFEAHNADLNHHRRYQITLGRDLIDDWTVAIRYGRAGQGGQEQRFASPQAGCWGVSGRDSLREPDMALGPLIRAGAEGGGPLELHDPIEKHSDDLGQAVEAVLGQEFRDLVQDGRLLLVGHHRLLVGTFQGNRWWPAASRPGEFTERMMHYRFPGNESTSGFDWD